MATDEERNKMAIVMLIFSAYAILKRMKSSTRAPIVNRDVERRMMLRRMYKESDNHCHEQLRMKRNVFYRLCDRLRAHGLVDRRSVTVKEQVAMFLIVIGQDASNQEGKFRFIRSGQTISRYFHTVLRAVISMYKEVVKPARRTNSPLDSGRDEDWYDYFEDAVGAIDGTYINATVPMDDQPRYRNRKGQIRQNFLVACTFDMKLTYVLAGWEGSAHDGRLLRDAVRPRDYRLTVPLEKYYLADAGFPNAPGFLTPFRGVRYHVKDNSDRESRNAKELYNSRHSRLRNVVERTIGLLKKRFAYLRSDPFFDTKTQTRVILACCVIHNYLRESDPDDICSNEADPKENEEEHDDLSTEEEQIIFSPSLAWARKREILVNVMWDEY